MISKILSNLPTSVISRVLMAMIANCNARIVAFARSEYNALRRLGMPDANQHVDGASRDALAREARRDELDATNATTQARDNGQSSPINASQLAEPFVSLKIALMDHFDRFCRDTHQPMPDQSLAGYLEWQKTMTFTPNQVLAKARNIASAGRITVEAAIRIQRDEFDADRQNLIANGEKILALAENFTAMETEGTELSIDAILEQMDPVTQLGIVNVLWRKLTDLWEGRNGFASGRFRTNDLSGDMSLVTLAEKDCLQLASEVYRTCEGAYDTRLAAGQSELAIVTAMLKARREAAIAQATPMRPTARAA